MRRDQPEKVVLVCAWNGQPDRFFGKYKVFGTTKWARIPGGVFPPQFDTKEKALLFANEWHSQEKISHEIQATLLGVGTDPTWDAICDAYLSDVNGRKRGKDSTRHEAVTAINASIRRFGESGGNT